MDWITGIQRALDYVEAHLMESVDYEEAAKQAYSSSFHFQRVFSILCGFTLGDYIRMRRLTLAGSELASSDIRVIDAALKYGYDTPESFSRAFTRFHGVPPSQAKHGAALKAFSPLSVKLYFRWREHNGLQNRNSGSLPAHLPKEANSQPGRIDGGGRSPHFGANAPPTEPLRRCAAISRNPISLATESWAPVSDGMPRMRNSPTPSARLTTEHPSRMRD